MLTLTTVVVTYNRKDLLLENLRMQLSQTYKPNHILIIDNHSSDETYGFLKSNGILDIKNILYYDTGENLGGAGGFNYGIRKAYETGDEIICLMDDDGKPIDSLCFEKAIQIIPYSNHSESIPIFINSLVLRNDVELTFPFEGKTKTISDAIQMAKNGFLEGQGAPFNGTFINRSLIEKIGLPRSDFFIRFDEYDYFLKAKDINAFIGIAVYSKYFHPSSPDFQTKRLLGHIFVNSYEVPWKEYYKVRNFTVLKISRGKTKIRVFLEYLVYLFGTYLFGVADKNIVRRFIRKGYKDAIKNRMGKTILPGQKTF